MAVSWQSPALHCKQQCGLWQVCHDKPLFIGRTIDQNYVKDRVTAREAV
jgi:hypothetical protein